MQCRVEGAIGCSKQHSRVALVCANAPTCFWPDATVDFTCKKTTLWAKRDEHGDLSTANNRMQPAFAGLYKTVAIPFGSHVTGYLPREHHLVKNGSFGDRLVEGIYLRSDHDTPCIRMCSITSGSEPLVQDFKSYPHKFCFRDPSCLLRCTPVIFKDLAKMHIDDAHDDNLVAEETALHAHTCTQTRAADAAKALDEPIILTTSSDDQTIDQIAPPPRAFATITDKIAPPLPHAKIVLQPPRTFPSITDEIALSDELANQNELAIARAFLRHSVEFVLPPHYRPDVTGKMRVIGVYTKKLTKIKAVLIVKFLTPQSLKDSTIRCIALVSSPNAVSAKVLTLAFLPLYNTLFPKQSHYMTLEFASCRTLTSQEQC